MTKATAIVLGMVLFSCIFFTGKTSTAQTASPSGYTYTISGNAESTTVTCWRDNRIVIEYEHRAVMDYYTFYFYTNPGYRSSLVTVVSGTDTVVSVLNDSTYYDCGIRENAENAAVCQVLSNVISDWRERLNRDVWIRP
jgi:hypothetical protein